MESFTPCLNTPIPKSKQYGNIQNCFLLFEARKFFLFSSAFTGICLLLPLLRLASNTFTGVCSGNLVFSEWSRDVLWIYDWWSHGEKGGHSRTALTGRTAQTEEEEEEEKGGVSEVFIVLFVLMFCFHVLIIVATIRCTHLLDCTLQVYQVASMQDLRIIAILKSAMRVYPREAVVGFSRSVESYLRFRRSS